jgi:hypothetical protein
MTLDEIVAAIEAAPELQGLASEGQTQAIADALSVGRSKVVSLMLTARGLSERYEGGPIAAEAVLMTLEATRDAMLAGASQEQRVLGSLLRRQLSFLNGDGLDFGSSALRGMLDRFAQMRILDEPTVARLKALAVMPDVVTHTQVGEALQRIGGK